MASAEAHWQYAARTEQFARLLHRSFTPSRYPTLAIAAFLAGSNYVKACLRLRGFDPRDDAQLAECLKMVPEFSGRDVGLPYYYLKNAFLDVFYLLDGALWSVESAAVVVASRSTRSMVRRCGHD